MIYSIFVGYILTNRRSIPQFNIRIYGRRHSKKTINAQNNVLIFIGYYNNERCHESLDNLTPADICFGKVEEE